MPLIPLQLPAGIYRNGTEFQSAGRWRDSNLVRWIDNTIRPVGGWTPRTTDEGDYPMRGALTWKDNDSNRYLAAGNATQLVTYLDNGNLIDITPAGLTAGRADASLNTGFGGSYYGYEYYGTERYDSQASLPATTWALDTWGEYLIACGSSDGKIYEWQLDRGTPAVAAQLSNAPVDNRSVVVTEERFVFALGADGNPRKVQWCDREDNTTWTPLATNEAGDIELQTNGLIECGHKVQGQTIILTDQDAHVATYIGGQFVYGFERVGSACGVISKKSAVPVQAGCFWMGDRNFYVYTGGSVQELTSEVDDYVFSNINRSQKSKICAVPNKAFNEIWWFYPSEDSTENDSYVVYNYRENIWFTGYMGRTTGVDAGIYRNPIFFCSATCRPFDHESGWDYHNMEMPWAETGAINLGNGDQVMVVTGMIPDELTQGDVQVKFKTKFYPNGDEREYGAYSMSNPTSMRFTGRQIKMRIEGVKTGDWRVGTNRLEVKAGGQR
jgi:hypothetical protein